MIDGSPDRGDIMIDPLVDDWVRWTTDNSVKEGKVVRRTDVSMVVQWLGGGEQVFPVIEYAKGLELISRPPRASSIERDSSRGVMSVARAAAILGTTPKRVRAKLREGSLTGTQRDGRWVSVMLDD
jgi:hypothetical protein